MVGEKHYTYSERKRHTYSERKEENMLQRKKLRTLPERSDLFDGLPDDIVLSILCKLSSTARCPSDFISILLTCKRLNRLALYPHVLSKSGAKTVAVEAKRWSEQSHRFLRLCAAAGSVEAYYTLGMIRFYCLQNRESGASLMAKAAIRSHAPALYSLAVIQFNGSGGSKNEKDLSAGVALCGRAAFLGHTNALRELGHCLQDGYGVRRDVREGHRLLVQANLLEIASVLRAATPPSHPRIRTWQLRNRLKRNGTVSGNDSDHTCPGVSGVLTSGAHPVNRFLTEWFGPREMEKGLRLCSNAGCGRPETRRNEFRRCSACGSVNYCSRACQADDWKMRHKAGCTPVAGEQLIIFNNNPEEEDDAADGYDDDDDDDRMVEVEGVVDGGGAS